MADPVKGRAEPEKGYMYKELCAPAVAMRAGCATKVPVVRGLGWVREAKTASREKRGRFLRWGRKSHPRSGAKEGVRAPGIGIPVVRVSLGS